MLKRLISSAAALATVGLLAAGVYYVWTLGEQILPPGVAAASGRVEATEVDVSSKLAGRLIELKPREGDMVNAGEVVGLLEPAEYIAQIAISTADAERSRQSLAVAESLVVVRRSELSLAQLEFDRASKLAIKGIATTEALDRRKQQLDAASASLRSSEAQLLEAKAAISAAEAMITHMKTYLEDTRLKAPIRGRVQYRLVEPGAVLAPGARVLTLVDLADVYMVTFVPAPIAGLIGIGDEARIELDAMPGLALRASVSFIDPEAQFTPKSVETRSERERLMFRVKLRVANEAVAGLENRAWIGLRGTAYLKTDPKAAWPQEPRLQPSAGSP